MREPQKFPRVLSGVMFCVAILFAGAGVMSYATYGSDIQTVVIVNLPQDDKFVQAVQFLCMSAHFFSLTNHGTNLFHRFCCHPPLVPPSTLPSCAYHGERSLFQIRQAQPLGQVAEECVQSLYCYLLFFAFLGRVQ